MSEYRDYRSPEGTVRNSGASDGGFLARASHELGGGLFSVGWQSDMGWDIGRPMNTPNVIRVSHPEEDSHRLTLSYDMDPLGGFTRVGFNGFLGSYRLVTERDERLPLSRSRRVRQADVSAKDFSFRALAVRPLGQSRLELGFDVNGRFDLEALDSEIVFDAGEGLVSESEQQAIDDASRTDTAAYANAEVLLGSRVSGGGGDPIRSRHDCEPRWLLRRPVHSPRRGLRVRLSQGRARVAATPDRPNLSRISRSVSLRSLFQGGQRTRRRSRKSSSPAGDIPAIRFGVALRTREFPLGSLRLPLPHRGSRGALRGRGGVVLFSQSR